MSGVSWRGGSLNAPPSPERGPRAIRARADLEYALAWDLAEAAKGLLGSRRLSAIFVMMGAGDSHAVIVRVLEGFASQGRFVPDGLVVRLGAWVDGYLGADDEHDLRHLVRRVSTPCVSSPSTEPQGVR